MCVCVRLRMCALYRHTRTLTRTYNNGLALFVLLKRWSLNPDCNLYREESPRGNGIRFIDRLRQVVS